MSFLTAVKWFNLIAWLGIALVAEKNALLPALVAAGMAVSLAVSRPTNPPETR